MRDLVMMDTRRGSRVRWFSRVGRLHVVHDPMAPLAELVPPLEPPGRGVGAIRENNSQDFAVKSGGGA